MSMTKIEHIEVGSGGAAEIEFTSISGDYTDLMILLSAQSSNSGTAIDNVFIEFNGTGTGYSNRYLLGTGSSVSSDPQSDGFFGQIGEALTNAFANIAIYVPSYTSGVAKSYSSDSVSEYNGTAARQVIVAGLWTGTAAITSVKLSVASPYDFVQYSSATLYGITAGSDGTTTVS